MLTKYEIEERELNLEEAAFGLSSVMYRVDRATDGAYVRISGTSPTEVVFNPVRTSYSGGQITYDVSNWQIPF